MNKTLNKSEQCPELDTSKRDWQTPTVVEMDYSETNNTAFDGDDLGIGGTATS